MRDNLKGCFKGLTWKPGGTEWVDYYSGDSYSQAGFDHKKNVVSDYLNIFNVSESLCSSKLCVGVGSASSELTRARVVWDLGANDGFFSRLASRQGAFVLSSDIDVSCVVNYYLNV